MYRFNTAILSLCSLLICITNCSKPTDNTSTDDTELPLPTRSVTSSITENTTWSSDITWIVSGNLKVSNAVLTIEPGTIIQFKENASLLIGYAGGLVADGTENTITFTGTQHRKGWWDYIRFQEFADYSNCRLINCTIEYGGGSENENGMIYCYYSSPTIENCIIRNSVTFGVEFYHCQATSFANNTITGCELTPIIIDFKYSGCIDSGAYSGNGYDYIYLKDSQITQNTTWPKQDIPYFFEHGTIDKAILTINAGNTIYMAEDASLFIRPYSGLIADGTSDTIIFSSLQKEKGAWNYIYFQEGASEADCRLINCIIEYGGDSENDDGMIYCDYSSPCIENCIIRNSSSYGVEFHHCGASSFTNNTITLCEHTPIIIDFAYSGSIGTGAYSGNKYDYIYLTSSWMKQNSTWPTQDIPYFLENSSIDNAILSISPGNTVYMEKNASLHVLARSGLIADGTLGTITFTSIQKQKGWWNCIDFQMSAIYSNCRLKNCVIEYGGDIEADNGMVYCYYSSPTIDNCLIQNSATYGIENYRGEPIVTNNTFADNKLGDIHEN